MGLFGGLNEIMFIKYFVWCLTQSKCSQSGYNYESGFEGLSLRGRVAPPAMRSPAGPRSRSLCRVLTAHPACTYPWDSFLPSLFSLLWSCLKCLLLYLHPHGHLLCRLTAFILPETRLEVAQGRWGEWKKPMRIQEDRLYQVFSTKVRQQIKNQNENKGEWQKGFAPGSCLFATGGCNSSLCLHFLMSRHQFLFVTFPVSCFQGKKKESEWFFQEVKVELREWRETSQVGNFWVRRS